MTEGTTDTVSAEELQKLIDNEEVESQTLEYKGKVPGKADSETDPAIKTVCAFANTAGGRIILGMETDQDGIPTRLKGITKTAVDQSKQRLESKLRTGIEPRVPPPDIAVVEVEEGEHVIVVDVPESWVGPHRWTRNNHFYRRASESNRELDIGEVRTAFAQSEGFTDKVANFRAERVWAVQSGTTPVPLEPGGRMILHIVPRAAFSSASNADIATLGTQNNRIQPMGGSGNHRVNLHGFFTYGTWTGKHACAYTQVFRNGSVEGVTILGSNGERPLIGCTAYEEMIIETVERYLEVANNIGVRPPYYVSVTFVNAKGAEFVVPRRLELAKKHEDLIAREDTLAIPEIVMAEMSESAAKGLRPLFDHVWNTFGFWGSFSYNDEGEWHRLAR